MNNIKAFKEYLEYEKKYSLHTTTAYINDLHSFETFIENEFEENNISQVSYALIRSWIVFLVDSGLENRSINRKLASLKAFYKFLLKIKQIQETPFLLHRALKTAQKVQIPFSEKEVDAILTDFEFETGFEGTRNKLIIDFLYTTGIRRAELINLKTANINLDQKTIKVLGKRNKERIIPILPILINQIKKYNNERAQLQQITNNDYFFLLLKGVKINETFVYRLITSYFSNVSKKAKNSPHVLRHTFATHLLNNGASLNAVKELLGHASLASTQVYTHSSLAELKKAHSLAHPRNKK